MKKNGKLKKVLYIHELKKLLMKMELITVFLVLGTITLYANVSYSQSTKISIKAKDITIKEVFKEIENNTEFIFFYYDSVINLDRKVSINIRNQSVNKLLDQLFESTDNSYEIIDRQIVITKKSSPLLPQLVSYDFTTLLPKLEQPRTKEITGAVIDANNQPLIGVSIVIKGTTTGTITDIAGYFKLDVPLDAKTLIFSYVGMKTQEIDIADKISFNVVMEEDVVGLEELVVVGYGMQQKETLVGAISQVRSEALLQAGTTSVTNAISGKLSGVLTMQQTGQPGNDKAEIIIRGLSSWNTSNPLVLVNGVERDFSGLDPNEISSISVLKDASATAVFGAKGANGVIIVTTKRGVLGKPKFGITASYGMEQATRIPENIDSYTTMKLLNVAFMNERRFTDLIPDNELEEFRNPSTPLNALRYPNVNWFKEVARPFAPTANANINITGGTDFIKYFTSLGYTYQGSYFDGYQEGYVDTRYWYNRINYTSNFDFKLTNMTQLSFNLSGEVGIQNQPKSSMWWALYGSSPARFPAYFPEWVLKEVPDPDYPNDSGKRLAYDYGEYTGNPYNIVFNSNFRRYLDSKLFTDVLLTQDLDFITKGLSVQGKVSLSTYYRNLLLQSDHTFPTYKLNFDQIGTGQNPWFRTGEGVEYFKNPPLSINVGSLAGGYYSDLYYEFTFNYKNSFRNHNISALALMNWQQKNMGTEFPYFNQGIVGRVTYNYLRKYLVEFNVGYTGSERFAPENRYGFFPSGAFGWVISEEDFFQIPWFSRLKLRYSDGLVGSDYAENRWLYISDFFKDSRGYIREDRAANTIAQWEEARKRDLGIEMSFLDNSISILVDFFNESRSKMLLTPKSIPLLVGNEFKDLNLGELKKHGFEIEVEYRKIKSKTFQYYMKGILGISENRIINKDDPPYTPEYQKEAGTPLLAQLSGVLTTGSGYFTSVDDIHNNISPISIATLNVGDYIFLDYTADGAITNLDTYPIKGSMYPPAVWSFSGGISYKNLDVSFLFSGNMGKYVEFNQTFEQEFTKGNYKVTASQLDYWTPTNPNANHATLHYYGSGYIPLLGWNPVSDATGYTTYLQDRLWRNADYFKLKDVFINYKIKTSNQKTLGLADINLFATGHNIFMVTRLIEGDPERKDFMTGFYPHMRTIKFGVKLGF